MIILLPPSLPVTSSACPLPDTHVAPDHEQQDGAEQHGDQHGKHHKEEVVERGLESDRDETNDSLLVTQVHLEEGEGEAEVEVEGEGRGRGR